MTSPKQVINPNGFPERVRKLWEEVFVKDKNSLPTILIARLHELEGLKPNWDSYSGLPVSTEAIKSATIVLLSISSIFGRELAENCFITPCSNGGLQLEWEYIFSDKTTRKIVIGINPQGEIS